MYIIFGNFGNQTLAVLQYAKDISLENTYVVSVDTRWHAQSWLQRVHECEAYAKNLGFKVIRLQARPDFENLMVDRENFPSTKFQWCAGFLKGLTLLNWLDEVDPTASATIILGKRQLDSKLNFDLEEYIDASEHYGDRKVWHPLFQHSDEQFKQLLLKTNTPILSGRSLECDPCVNSFGKDLARLDEVDIIKTKVLEAQVGKPFFNEPIEIAVEKARDNQKESTMMFDMGCGSPYACGE